MKNILFFLALSVAFTDALFAAEKPPLPSDREKQLNPLVSLENGEKAVRAFRTSEPLLTVTMDIIETIHLAERTPEIILRDIYASYAVSPQLQADFATAEEFVDATLPEISALEKEDTETEIQSRFRVISSRIKGYGAYYGKHSHDQNALPYLEIVQYMNPKAKWDSWTFNHRQKTIRSNTTGTARYREYTDMRSPEFNVIFNWISTKKKYKKEHEGKTWIHALCHSDKPISKWQLLRGSEAGHVRLRFSEEGKDIIHEYDYDVSGEEARLMRKHVRLHQNMQTWIFQYPDHAEDSLQGFPCNIQYTQSSTSEFSVKMNREISILKVSDSIQWDSKIILNDLEKKHSDYSRGKENTPSQKKPRKTTCRVPEKTQAPKEAQVTPKGETDTQTDPINTMEEYTKIPCPRCQNDPDRVENCVLCNKLGYIWVDKRFENTP